MERYINMNPNKLKYLFVCLIGMALSGRSLAFCSEPTMGSVSVFGVSSFSSPPPPPYCLSNYRYSGRHSCDAWELSSYRSSVEDYVESYKRYQREALNVTQRFLDAANEYSRCRIDEAIDQYNEAIP